MTVTCRHAKSSHTYAAARPPTGSRRRQQRHAVGRAAGDDDVRPERAANHAFERRGVRADDRDLLDPCVVEVERLEQVAERGGMLRGDGMQEPEHAECALLVAVLAGQRREPQEAERGG